MVSSPKIFCRKETCSSMAATILAKHVWEGKTKAYTNHPELKRFKNSKYLLTLNNYLAIVYQEATYRGYKISKPGCQNKMMHTYRKFIQMCLKLTIFLLYALFAVSCNSKPVYYVSFLNKEIMIEQGFAGEKLILKENNNNFFPERIIPGSGIPVIEKTTIEVKIKTTGAIEKIESVFHSTALNTSTNIEMLIKEKDVEIYYDKVKSRITSIK